jgi:hypothetical protein
MLPRYGYLLAIVVLAILWLAAMRLHMRRNKNARITPLDIVLVWPLLLRGEGTKMTPVVKWGLFLMAILIIADLVFHR